MSRADGSGGFDIRACRRGGLKEGREIPVQFDMSSGSAAVPRGGEAPRSGLPAFVTPDWLRERHHLMRADRRKLAALLGKEYGDWPADADGTDEGAFWRAAHAFAQRWTWFLWLFEDRIGKMFGQVKGDRKQLGPRVLREACERAESLRPASLGGGEPTVLDDLETLWQAREHELVAQSVWVLSCLEGVDSRLIALPWLAEPEIQSLVGDAVRRMRLDRSPERADLVERLLGGRPGPHLEGLAARADAVCETLRREVREAWGLLREHVAAHEDYPAAEEKLSFLLLRLEGRADDLDELEGAQREALARCRHGALRALLQEPLDALPETRFAGQADLLKDRTARILDDVGAPLGFPDPEWERCCGLAGRFRAEIMEPGERERTLQEASRRYAESPNGSNLEALQAAAEAVRAQPVSSEPASALDAMEACLRELVGTFGSVEARAAAELEDVLPAPADREGALRAQIDELKAANRDAEERMAALLQAREDVDRENAGLRSEKHRLQQRLAALEGGAVPAEDGCRVPTLESYVELPAWTERHFGGRVALSGRALRSLKGAEFEDVGLVGRAIRLLGETYWHMKTGGGKELRRAFDDELSALRLLETPSLSRDRQGKARDDFSIEWNGRRLVLDRHLKTAAKTRDPRYCFRLYFAWDDRDRQVVIGHLPGHMKT